MLRVVLSCEWYLSLVLFFGCSFQQEFTHYLEFRKQGTANEDNDEFVRRVGSIAQRLFGTSTGSQAEDARDFLKKTARLKDNSIFTKFTTLVTLDTPYSELRETQSDIVSKSKQNVVRQLVKRAAFTLLTKDSIPVIFDYLHESLEDESSTQGATVLKFLEVCLRVT